MASDDQPDVDAIQVRSTGAYSLISRQPLARHGPPGQPVTAAHALWLKTQGLYANLAELCVLKSDDLENRDQFHQAVRGNAPFPKAGIPHSLGLLIVYLRTLGVATEVQRRQHASLRLQPLSDDDACRVSSGLIRKPETLHYRTFEPV